jgi:hypothetical protein
MKVRLVSVVVLVALVWLTLTPVGEVLAAREPIDVQIKHPARLMGAGQTALVTVRVRCAPVGQLLESLLYVVQDDQTSQFAGLPVTCDNRWHTQVVTVRAFEETPFRQGEAYASAYVLLYDPDTGETWQGQDNGSIRLR